LAKKYGLFYTRYADDITFSSNRRTLPIAVAVTENGQVTSIGSALTDTIAKHKFQINAEKTRLGASQNRKAVTGLIVNNRLNVPRQFIARTRAMLRAWKKYEYDAAAAEYGKKFDFYNTGAEFRKVVAGRLSHIGHIRGVDDRVFRRLYGWARQLEPATFPALPPLANRAASLRAAIDDFPAISRADSSSLRREYLRRMFASTRGMLWLVDANLNIQPIKDMVKVIEPARTPVVRLLSQDKPITKQFDEFAEIKKQLVAQGFKVEWRIHPDKVMHDRWVADDNDCVALGGPFNHIYSPKPTFGQNRAVRKPDQFETWWNQASPI